MATNVDLKETVMRYPNFSILTRPFALALGAAFLLALLFAPLGVEPAQAQHPDCYTVIYETQETSIPFMPGLTISRLVSVGKKFDPACSTPNDGRVNINDNAAAAAIYCTEYGVSIWDIDDISRGTPSFLVTYDALDTIPSPLEENMLVGENGGFRLYALTSGELQLNSPPDWEGKEYVFTWPGCDRPQP
jgi:hypothetical protein